MGRAVPEVLVMSGAVKIFTLNTALWDMSSREGERETRKRDVKSFPPSIFPFPPVIAYFFPASRQIKWVSITHQYNTPEGKKRRI